MEQNRSILIHAGAGGVGISAINIALSLNSTIFVTVGSEKKKQFLRDLFPQLKGENIAVYVHHDQYCNIVRTKGIEVMGIKFSTAPRRKNVQQGEAFENIAFVKYISPENKKYNLDQSLAIALNIVLQNMFGFIKNVIVRELKTEDSKVPNEIQVKTELYYSKKVFVVSEYSSIKPNNIDSKIDLLILDYRMIEKYREYFRTLKEDAFILCIGNLENTKINEFEVIFQTASLSLLRLKQDPITYDEIIQIRENDYKWLETIKTVSKSITSKNVLLYSENDYMNGIVGLNYCLMSEDDIKVAFRSVLVNQIAPPFSIGNSYYTNQLSKNLAFNILQDNEWGTFVPIAAEPVKPRVVENAGLTIFKPGDLSTLGWTETRKSRSRIFMAGGQPDLRSLYPRPSFPLTRGTKFLSSIIEWDHTAKWDCPNPRKQDYFGTPVLVNLSDPKYSYLADHLIDGRSIMPAAGYL
uniref:Fatty acid synthase-like n=1 Tax=Diabrotica virgifera virgifera TaxID=50390 RepID=A0A6P7GW60_DIAVI